jgi:hypothetical protein
LKSSGTSSSSKPTALADRSNSDAHARAADRLAERYDLPLVSVLTHWYAGLRLAIDGNLAEAEATYRAARARVTGIGMLGMEDGLLPLALLSLHLQTPANQGTTRMKEPNLQREHSDPDDWEKWNWGTKLLPAANELPEREVAY